MTTSEIQHLKTQLKNPNLSQEEKEKITLWIKQLETLKSS